MADKTTDKTPQVTDLRTSPSGILPKNTQTWVITSLAVVMVVAIWISGGKAPKEHPAAPRITNSVMDPNVLQIQEYKKRLEEETRKLDTEQTQLKRHEEALGATSSQIVRPNQIATAYSPESYPAPGEVAIRAAKEKREYESLFASNVAFTLRKEAASMPKDGIPQSADEMNRIVSFYSALAALQRSGPASTSPTPTAGGPALGVPAALESIHATPENAEPKTRARQNGKNSAHGNHDYPLFEGTFIETVLTNRLDGSFSGPVNCMVTTNVYSHDGQHLLIPQGARALGEVRKVETFGQERLAVSFHRLVMPDSYSVDLDRFEGLNQIGETGLKDLVNHHYLQVFGVSLAIGGIAGLGQSQSRTGLVQSGADAYEQGVATSLSQSSLRILDRYLNVLPTFTIREGHRVKIYLSDDLWLPAYDQHQIPNEGGL
jgi:type IV secretion system protein VirB10